MKYFIITGFLCNYTGAIVGTFDVSVNCPVYPNLEATRERIVKASRDRGNIVSFVAFSFISEITQKEYDVNNNPKYCDLI